MLRRLFEGIKQGAGRVFGALKEPIQRLGQFAVKNHQPLAMLLNQAAQMSDNPYVRMIGTGAIGASALATKAGIGNNYLQPPPQPT
jgi:hypothetical protein